MDFAISRTQIRSKQRWPLPKSHWLVAASLISSLVVVGMYVALGRIFNLSIAMFTYGYWSFVFRSTIDDIKNYVTGNQDKAPTPITSRQDLRITTLVLCGNVALLAGNVLGLFS